MESMEGFSKRQLEGTKCARDAYKILVFPSMHDFIAMVHHNLIRNCPITVDDIKNVHKIYDPDIASLKGKTVQRVVPVVRTDYIYVPCHIFENTIK